MAPAFLMTASTSQGSNAVVGSRSETGDHRMEDVDTLLAIGGRVADLHA